MIKYYIKCDGKYLAWYPSLEEAESFMQKLLMIEEFKGAILEIVPLAT